MNLPNSTATPAIVAHTLNDVSAAARLEPLLPDDPRYAPLQEGHRGRNLQLMRQALREAAESGTSDFLKMVLTGHRGCGKSTELFRIEGDLSDVYYPVHLTLDEGLKRDFDYSLMLLWLCEELVRQLAADNVLLDPAEVENVARWFAERTETLAEIEKIEASATVEMESEAGISLPGMGMRILARLRMQASGSAERRIQIKSKLQNSASDLIDRVNRLLESARIKLAHHGRPARLLIVQDNLDRLDKDAARILFGDTGEYLHRIAADCIFTAPIAQSLAPVNLQKMFPDSTPLPTIKVRRKDGGVNREGIDALVGLLKSRVDMPDLFDSKATREQLCLLSGGSVRDLVRLLGVAGSYAKLDNKTTIDAACVDEAATKIRKEYQGILVPARAYFPRLAIIHRDKSDGLMADDALDGAAADKDREHFSHLLINGTVLEYDNGQIWYDVHPLVQQLNEFEKAQAALAARADG